MKNTPDLDVSSNAWRVRSSGDVGFGYHVYDSYGI